MITPYSARKLIIYDVRINCKAPQETVHDPAILLPDAEPTTPQVSYTVTEGDLPDITVDWPIIYVAVICLSGKNVGSASRRVYHSAYKNGEAVHTNHYNSVSVNYYWTHNVYFYDVKVGDVLEVSLWSNVADEVNFDYEAYQIEPTRHVPPGTLFISAYHSENQFVLSQAPNPFYLEYSPVLYNSSFMWAQVTSGNNMFLTPHPEYGLWRLYSGDYNQMNSSTKTQSNTYHPYVYVGRVPKHYMCQLICL